MTQKTSELSKVVQLVVTVESRKISDQFAELTGNVLISLKKYRSRSKKQDSFLAGQILIFGFDTRDTRVKYFGLTSSNNGSPFDGNYWTTDHLFQPHMQTTDPRVTLFSGKVLPDAVQVLPSALEEFRGITFGVHFTRSSRLPVE